jgi:D-alanyl-D-alanine carboxypeptidase
VKTKLKSVAVALMTGVALWSLTGLSSCQRQQESAIKPIDKAALQTLVDTTSRELLIPGAVVLLRTPQGEFTVSYGTALLRFSSASTTNRLPSARRTSTIQIVRPAVYQVTRGFTVFSASVSRPVTTLL